MEPSPIYSVNAAINVHWNLCNLFNLIPDLYPPFALQ